MHKSFHITYLKSGNYNSGLLLNFDVSTLKEGIKRRINTD